jgi:hypothetical protein
MTNKKPSNDKRKYWAHKKKITNDGIVNSKMVSNIGPMLTLKAPNMTNVPNKMPNAIQENQEHGQQRKTRNYPPKHQCSPLGEPIEFILKQLLQSKCIQLPPIKHYETRQFKPFWWDDNATYEYHCTK